MSLWISQQQPGAYVNHFRPGCEEGGGVNLTAAWRTVSALEQGTGAHVGKKESPKGSTPENISRLVISLFF